MPSRILLFYSYGVLALLAFPLNLQAQQALLAGRVLDASTGQPIPFAVVEVRSRQVGVQASEQGTFTLELPTSLATTDSLQVSSLGFRARVLLLPSASPCQLVLQRLAVALPEAVVRASNTAPIRLGPSAAGDAFGFGGGARLSPEFSNGWQVARHFDTGSAGFIQAVRFYVKPNPNCGKTTVQTPFRVRIYAADGPGGAPGTDLLIDSKFSSAAKKGWHEVDLSKQQLRVPAAGFFVAMEWLYTKPEFGCEFTYTTSNKEKIESRTYGQSLGGYLNAEPQASWYLSAGNPWRQFEAAMFQSKGVPAAAIQAIVQPD